VLFKSLAFAGGAPVTLQENQLLSKEIVGKYKSLNDSMMGYYGEIYSILSLCSQVNGLIINKCTNKKQCDDFVAMKFKDKISYCMMEFRRLRNKGDLVKKKKNLFYDELHDVKHENLNPTAETLREGYVKLGNVLGSAQMFLKEAYQVYGIKFQEIMLEEYKKISTNAELKGKLKGQCILLKQQINDLENLFLLNAPDLDYGHGYQFYNQVKATRTISDTLRPKCPTNWQPANYIDLEARALAQLQKLDKKKWLLNKCRKIKENKNYSEVCSSRNIGEAQLMNILIGVSK
jgi:hypothetical protein